MADVSEPLSEIVNSSVEVSEPVSEIVNTSLDVSEPVSEIVNSSVEVSEPVSEIVNTTVDVSEPVPVPAGRVTPLHLENITSTQLKTILERSTTMVSNYLSGLCEQAATLSIGQFLLHKGEDSLWAVEKSIEWSAPSEPKTPAIPLADEKELNGLQRQESVPEGRTSSRPVPWIFFIPILVMWRCTRVIYETTFSLLGKAPVQPDDVVQFLRNRRRGLRALRIRGKRTMKTHGGNSTVLCRMTSLANPLIVTVNKMLALVGITTKKESKRDLEVSTRSVTAKEEGQDSPIVSAKESVLEQLNRLSNVPDNVDDDPDFEPDSSRSSEVSSSSESNASVEDKVDKEDTPMPSRTSSFIADIIEEEDETTDLDTPTSTTTRPTDDDVSENGDFASLSARSSDIFTDTCESTNSALHKISNVFKKGLGELNSL